MTSINTVRKPRWLLAVLLLAPTQIAAKGCQTGIVGDDGHDAGVISTGGAAAGGASASTGGAVATGAAPSNGGTGSNQPCGGLTGAQCGQGEYCQFASDAQCGAADRTGICTVIPQACLEYYAPVCGCDGKTYGNSCDAASHGVSVASQGTCGNAGNACGGLTGAPCGQDEFCKYAPDAQCGAADQTGICTVIPQACDLVYAPVCGCDGKTYGNECQAWAAETSVAATGACSSNPGGNTCGGIAALKCGSGEYCNYPMEAKCGAADQTGACTAIPQACDLVYAPVCGCDGKTYSNSCAAAMAGVSVATSGECQ